MATTTPAVTPRSFIHFDPPEFGLSLAGLYGVWVLVIVLMYRPVKWFSGYRQQHRKWWLSYV